LDNWTYVQIQLDIQLDNSINIYILRNNDNLNFFSTLHFFFVEMPPPKHSHTKYITVLNEKANKSNYFALCCYCKIKIINTKRLVISHLKSCKKFEERYTENERDRILYPEKYEEKNQTEGESSLSYEQESSFSSSSLSRSSRQSLGIFFKIIFFCDLKFIE
jgi:hypothetical protein